MYESNQTVTVRDYMARKVLAFAPEDDVADIAATLLEHHIWGAPVVDSQKKVVGFVSEQDCIKEMLNTAWHCELTATAVDVMHPDVLTVSPDMGISDLAQQLCENKPKMYPVVEDGEMVGVITRSDVLRALVDMSARCHSHTKQVVHG